MAYTYDNFVSAANAAGLMNQFSEQDLQIAQRNPEFGLSLLSLLKDNSNATTAEQQLLATEAANQLRKSYGVYNTGTLGTDSAYAGSYGTQINDLMDQIKDYGSFDYANQDEYQKLLDQITNYGSFSYANQDSYQQLLDSIVNQQPFSYDLQSDPSWGSYKNGNGWIAIGGGRMTWTELERAVNQGRIIEVIEPDKGTITYKYASSNSTDNTNNNSNKVGGNGGGGGGGGKPITAIAFQENLVR